MMKKTIRCGKCKERVVMNNIGFVKKDDLRCAYFDIPVDKGDGCTLGKEGDSKYKHISTNIVRLEGHEVVFDKKYY